jgi:hypothetical protein
MNKRARDVFDPKTHRRNILYHEIVLTPEYRALADNPARAKFLHSLGHFDFRFIALVLEVKSHATISNYVNGKSAGGPRGRPKYLQKTEEEALVEQIKSRWRAHDSMTLSEVCEEVSRPCKCFAPCACAQN